MKSAFGALTNPERADLVSATADLSSHRALERLQAKMKEDSEGSQILKDMPRVNSTTWNFDDLLTLPENSFGHVYASHMSAQGLNNDDRPLVKYVSNPEHAYILQRYKETHDITHVLLDYGITVSEEIAIKWFEMIQTELPMNALASFVGPLNLILIQRDMQQMNKLT